VVTVGTYLTFHNPLSTCERKPGHPSRYGKLPDGDQNAELDGGG
jgi:hypothetical protein